MQDKTKKWNDPKISLPHRGDCVYILMDDDTTCKASLLHNDWHFIDMTNINSIYDHYIKSLKIKGWSYSKPEFSEEN